ncbi:MAG: radical SAM protein [Euryarchaeota archaeon]|nr:radical SAM protein [Euryarchaeota archaeon]
MRRAKWHHLGHDRCTVPIYEASSPRGVVPLLKTLMSSYCTNDCKFCMFRSSRRIDRYRWEPEELTRIAIHLWEMKKIKGLFLSSSFEGDPDETVERQLETVRMLRRDGFTGYIHLRLMPGTGTEKIKESMTLCDRIGINIEFPNKELYEEMKGGPIDFSQDVMKRMEQISRIARKECQADVDTQIVVGIEDYDDEILEKTEWLYKKLNLARVYYSGFEPIPETPLENHPPCPKLRELRLYQTSFLLRDYGFKLNDVIFDGKGMLPVDEDPKFLAAKTADLFLNINEASYLDLLRVPGIGPVSAIKILKERPLRDEKRLRSIGVNLKRARPFIFLKGTQKTLVNEKVYTP